MINTSNGHLQLPAITLTPEMELDELLKSLTNNLEVEDVQTGWKWITLKNIKLKELTFNFRVGFLNERLTQLYFVFETKDSANWEPWNRDSELKKLELYRTWLNNEIGTHRDFNWGHVSEAFDEKGGFSSITIDYELIN